MVGQKFLLTGQEGSEQSNMFWQRRLSVCVCVCVRVKQGWRGVINRWPSPTRYTLKKELVSAHLCVCVCMCVCVCLNLFVHLRVCVCMYGRMCRVCKLR